MPLTQETFAAVVLEDVDGRWEIVCGKLREKPEMSVGHYLAARVIAHQLDVQLSFDDFQVMHNAGHASVADGDSYIPDLAIVPTAFVERLMTDPRSFERYDEPLPLVVEIWSPSTGSYDIDRKIPGYKARGDLEIWRLHPYHQSLMIWRRLPEGAYSIAEVSGGTIALHALPEVTIDLDAVFKRA
jgi:Uma2 family endonuclease